MRWMNTCLLVTCDAACQGKAPNGMTCITGGFALQESFPQPPREPSANQTIMINMRKSFGGEKGAHRDPSIRRAGSSHVKGASIPGRYPTSNSPWTSLRKREQHLNTEKILVKGEPYGRCQVKKKLWLTRRMGSLG